VRTAIEHGEYNHGLFPTLNIPTIAATGQFVTRKILLVILDGAEQHCHCLLNSGGFWARGW